MRAVDRAYYHATIAEFLGHGDSHILAELTRHSPFAVETTQVAAWSEQVDILRRVFGSLGAPGSVYFEFTVPRVGRRIDVLAVIQHVVFVLEFKVGESEFRADAVDQVWDYALDLKNFHSTTHDKAVVPVVVATRASSVMSTLTARRDEDGVLRPVCAAPADLGHVMRHALAFCDGPSVDIATWESGRYSPTPTIIEAATALYGGHSVEEISRSDASAINLSRTSEAIAGVIQDARACRRKVICFVTGVPGAGKTLVGLNIAARHMDRDAELYSVFLSGNGPLVNILREALARDKVRGDVERGGKRGLTKARKAVETLVQNVHHFRDDCLADADRPPIEHVALFDEAQRAWNREQTAKFMRQKRGRSDFDVSEPEFLISCMDRHSDWAVVVCLVGGGQEINTGEAGISEWIDAIMRFFPHWRVHVSPKLEDSEFGAGEVLRKLAARADVHLNADLHLAVSMRSFRAENVSMLVKRVLDRDTDGARQTLGQLRDRYPISLTRDLAKAKTWLRSKARGSERYGMIVSSQAQRLKPHAIDVRVDIDPIHWFLDPRDDVRSSYYLEDAATEFDVQGLELDWACVVWDADFRYTPQGWRHWSFKGNRWERIKAEQRQVYLKNAYRVLLTRARQGMVIVVPKGDETDVTRSPAFYDATFNYLLSVGFSTLE
ncbi:MAG: DUF2075 domain-containing protein [Phycisphaerae bacterium]|nr:DUF2075 domain-containing protein [Phycisphaerae bacterium]